jgi:hypothetical protein
MPAVRAAQHHHNDAVFRRESFLCRVVGCDIGLSSVTNSPRLSAGGACPSTADSDIPCRVHGSPPRLPPLGCAAAPLLERRVLPRLPGPIHRAPVRAHDFTAQDVFDWCDPDPLGPGVVTSRKSESPISQLEHPCRPRLQLPAGQGDGTPPQARLRRSPRTLRLATPTRGPDEDRMPLTRSLQPTCCQRAPLVPTYSRARGSHLPDLPAGTQPFPNTNVLTSDCVPRFGAR